jgi:tRNA modification GTPase
LEPSDNPEHIHALAAKTAETPVNSKKRIVVLNKIDQFPEEKINAVSDLLRQYLNPGELLIPLSAKSGTNLTLLEQALIDLSGINETNENDVIVTNLRHYQALENALEALKRANNGLNNGLPGDLLAQDIREALHYLGEITGEITTDEVLGNIFKNFCIGK